MIGVTAGAIVAADVGLAWQTVSKLGDAFFERLPYIAIGGVVVFVFAAIGFVLRRVIAYTGRRTRLDETLAGLLGRLVFAATVILGLLVAAVIVFPTFKPGDLIAGLGITSVAIGFAFKDILQNFFAGILILWRQPFRLGDQIRSNDFEGTVEDITVRSTRLRTYDGERAVLPNAQVYTSPILVRTAFDNRRVRFIVGIGYPDSIEDARRTIEDLLKGTDGVLQDPGPWVYVSELAPSSVNFTVYFWVAPPDQATILRVSNAVATAIKLKLDEAGIDIPYPHNVVLFHDATGTRDGDIDRDRYLERGRPENGRPAHPTNGEQPHTSP